MSWLRLSPQRGSAAAGTLARRIADALGLRGVVSRVQDRDAPPEPSSEPWATLALRVGTVHPHRPVAVIEPTAADRDSAALASALGDALRGVACVHSRAARLGGSAQRGCAVDVALPRPQPGADARARAATLANRVVAAATKAVARLAPGGRVWSRATHSRHFDVWHQVPLVPQLTGMSCWAACAAMIVGWRDRLDVDPAEIAAGAGRWQAYREGLEAGDTARFAATWHLVADPRRTFSVDDLRSLLEEHGPLWVGQADPDLHVICIVGSWGDGSEDGTFVRVNDPWPLGRGERYRLSVRELMVRYRTAGLCPAIGAQILYAPSGRGSSRVQHHVRSDFAWSYRSGT